MRAIASTIVAVMACACVAAGAIAQGVPPPAGTVTIIRAARLIDGRDGAPLSPAMVRIEGERITAVGSSLPVPAGARQINLGDATLLPGFIDLHTHI